MKDIQNVLVVGAGMMGKNIAFALTENTKLKVIVTDIAEQDVRGGIRENCRQLVAHGVISEQALEDRLHRIVFTTDMKSDLVKTADLVIEAVFEDIAVKRKNLCRA